MNINIDSRTLKFENGPIATFLQTGYDEYMDLSRLPQNWMNTEHPESRSDRWAANDILTKRVP